MGGDHHLVVVEQLFAAFAGAGVAQVGVAAQLDDGFRHRIGDVGRLALDHPQGQTIHVEQDVGNDGLRGTLKLELIDAEKLVVAGGVKIDQFHGVAAATLAQVLLHAEEVGEPFPEPLIGLHQGGGLAHGDLSHHLAQVVVADPGVEALDRLLQVGGEHHLLEGGAVVGGAGDKRAAIEVGPAELLELLQGGKFDLLALVACHG